MASDACRISVYEDVTVPKEVMHEVVEQYWKNGWNRIKYSVSPPNMDNERLITLDFYFP